MAEKYDPNALWVAISEHGDGNLFQVYPRLLAQLLLEEEAARQPGDTSEAESIVLPSDKEWRLRQYFFLVSLQKELELDLLHEEDAEKPKRAVEPPEPWAPWSVVVSAKNPNAPPPVSVRCAPGPVWDIAQVLKAGKLLCKPPRVVDFQDEQEMRCVYSLIYDVFRYKSILDQAIEDIDFFEDFPEFALHRHLIWLFLMELARRRWLARPRDEADAANKLLSAAGQPFLQIELILWEQRVHLAASVARIRIKNRAFALSELLPPHLREEKISACVNKETVTGWVNTFKSSKVAQLVKRLHELGFSYSASKQLCAGEYGFDRVCPRFITLRPPENVCVGQLDLVKNGIIVLQEREFCEGASTLCRALRANEIQGVVAQTHASSPRCSAYLAAQLRELAAVLKAKAPAAPATPELGRLVVFGAGDKVDSYVCALRELGIEAAEAPSTAAVCVLSDPVHCETPAVLGALEGVVAVLATPPNSYSAVTDPIDLVCGRGGDLAMLEILTESEIDSKGRARVQSILEEQKKTLKTLMSKPQIQLILYETHSALEAENQAQVSRAVAEANRLARERHALLKKKQRDHHPKVVPVEAGQCASSELGSAAFDDAHKLEDQPQPSRPVSAKSRPQSGETVISKPTERAGSGSRPGTTRARPIPPEPNPPEAGPRPKDPDDDFANIVVPNCDLFEVGNLPHLGNGLDINFILDRDGCYLGLIQRKEITRLDAKFMIRVAEDRGLFGAAAPAQAAKPRRKEAPVAAPKRRRRKHSFELERVAAPTYASLTRSAPAHLAGAGAGGVAVEGLGHVCSRHARRQAAASRYTSAACSCDARHRHRCATGGTEHPPGPAPPPCRRPFPLAVTDLRLLRSSAHLL